MRRLKGFYMLLMYTIFAGGIAFELIGAWPVVALLNRMFGFKASRMHSVTRFLMSTWLGLLRAGGLIKRLPSVGTCFSGPCVIVANHPGLFDVIFLVREIPNLSLLVKRALVRDLPLGPVFRASGYVVAHDEKRGSPVETLQDAVAVLKSGARFMVFPEGSRSPKGGLRPFHAGAFAMARRAGVCIQPVLIRNTPPLFPHEDPWYFPCRPMSTLQVTYWEPIPVPAAGEDRALASALEQRYRDALGG